MELLEQAVQNQRANETDAARKTQQLTLMLAGVFGLIGLGVMLLMIYYQWRAFKQIAEISTQQNLFMAQAGAVHQLTGPARATVEISNSRLLNVVGQLEHKIRALENGGGGNGNSAASPEKNGSVTPDPLADAMCVPRGSIIDRWMEVRWHAPGNMALFGGGVATGRPRSEGQNVGQVHCFTPETERTTHYWFGIAFPRSLGDMGRQMAEERIDWLKVPFETEDLPMLQAQQQNFEEFGEQRPVLLSGDSGGVKARRVLDRLIAAEQTP